MGSLCEDVTVCYKHYEIMEGIGTANYCLCLATFVAVSLCFFVRFEPIFTEIIEVLEASTDMLV